MAVVRESSGREELAVEEPDDGAAQEEGSGRRERPGRSCRSGAVRRGTGGEEKKEERHGAVGGSGAGDVL